MQLVQTGVPPAGSDQFDVRLVEVQPRRGESQPGHGELPLANVDPVDRRGCLQGEFVCPGQFPIVHRVPGSDAPGPGFELSADFHFDGPGSAVVEVEHRLGNSGVDPVGSGPALQAGRLKPGVAAQVGGSGGREKRHQILLRPGFSPHGCGVFRVPRTGGRGQQEVAYLEFGIGFELLPRRAFPIQVCPTVSRQLNPAQVDKPAQLLGQLLQVEAGVGGQAIGCADGVEFQEVGFTLEALHDRSLRRLVRGQGDQDRPLPGEFLPSMNRAEVAGRQTAAPDGALRTGTAG